MPPKIDTYRYIIYVLGVLQADCSLTLKTFCERMILVEKDILSDGKKTTVMTLDKATENLLQFSIWFLKNLKFTIYFEDLTEEKITILYTEIITRKVYFGAGFCASAMSENK